MGVGKSGAFLSGAIALAISPTDHNHLLLGTESGLFASRNGGRDWDVEAPSLILGSVFAVSFSKDGQRALASTGAGLFSFDVDHVWRNAQAPWRAVPGRPLFAVTSQVVLFGRQQRVVSQR